MILSFCDNPDVLKVMRIIDVVITIIKVSGPIILIVSCMLDYMNAVKDNDNDALQKSNKIIVKRIIAAMLIFMIPTFVKLIANITSNTVSYSGCIANATREGINNAYYNISTIYINNAYKSKIESDYKLALNYLNNVKDEAQKQEQELKLYELKQYFVIKDMITSYKDYDQILNEINKLTNKDLKLELTTLLEKSGSGRRLNIESSFNKYKDSTYSSLNGYYLYIPKNATENMPLIVVFPPNSLSSENMKKIVQKKSLDNLKAFIYIPTIASSGRMDWNISCSKSAVKKIQDLVKQYKINEKKISLTAFSSSGYYIYWTANEYRIFSAIAPLSSGMTINKIKSYNDWEYLKTLPMKGYGEKGGATTASGRSCANKTVNWSAKSAMCSVFEGLGKCGNCTSCQYFTYLPEVCHGEIGDYVFSIDENNNGISDIMEWMIKQTK